MEINTVIDIFEGFEERHYLIRKFMSRWRQLANRAENLRKFVKIALVGKYTQLEDAYASVIKATPSIQHCHNSADDGCTAYAFIP